MKLLLSRISTLALGGLALSLLPVSADALSVHLLDLGSGAGRVST